MAHATVVSWTFYLLALLAFLQPHYSFAEEQLSRKDLSRLDRRLQQCSASCPAQSDAASACAKLSSSAQSNIRNTLIANCGTSTYSGSSNGCCSAIPISQWSDYLNCMCAGDAVLAGLSAFVSVNEVVATCGCRTSGSNPSAVPSTSGSSVTVQLPENTTLGRSATPQPSSGQSENPVAAQILSSQPSPSG